jgi:hypothetical protein
MADQSGMFHETDDSTDCREKYIHYQEQKSRVGLIFDGILVINCHE